MCSTILYHAIFNKRNFWYFSHVNRESNVKCYNRRGTFGEIDGENLCVFDEEIAFLHLHWCVMSEIFSAFTLSYITSWLRWRIARVSQRESLAIAKSSYLDEIRSATNIRDICGGQWGPVQTQLAGNLPCAQIQPDRKLPCDHWSTKTTWSENEKNGGQIKNQSRSLTRLFRVRNPFILNISRYFLIFVMKGYLYIF